MDKDGNMKIKNKTSSVGFISLGCPKATVDSERILTRLRAEGYLISGSYQDSDLVVVNTCGFIDNGKGGQTPFTSLLTQTLKSRQHIHFNRTCNINHMTIV